MLFPEPTPQQYYKFTNDQKKELLKAWKKDSEEDKAEEFLDKIEPTIAYWMFITKPPRQGEREKSEQLEKIQKHAELLINALNDAHPESIKWLGIQADSIVYSKKEEFSLIRKKIPVIYQEKNAQLKHYHPLLDQMLSLINASSIELINARKDIDFNSKTGWKSHLVLLLAQDYEDVFKKKPGYSKSSSSTPFTRFLVELSEILSIQIGPASIKSGLHGENHK